MLMSPSHDVQPHETAAKNHSSGPNGQADRARHPLQTRVDAGLDWAGKAAAFCVTRLQQSSEFVFALVMTAIFYFPSLRNGSRDAGFLYGGDVLGFYWPCLAKLQSLLSRHQFVALDFSQFNASADFFLAANFFACHPLFVIWSLCTSPETITFQAAGRILVWALVIHTFIACYFTLRLLTRFLQLDFWVAAFAAAAFAFSVYAINAHGEPMFVFRASIVPWAAYAALDYEEHRGVRRLLLAAFPVLVGYLAGYIPLGVACLGIAAFIIGVKLFLLDEQASTLAVQASRYFAALLPFVLGSLVATPYLVEVFFFLKSSPSASKASLYYSAHQMADLPQSILRALSFRAPIPGPFYEFSITLGLIAVAVIVIFLLSSKTLGALTRREWTIVKLAAFVYFTIVLSIFGQHSVVSDLVFYFIPQVGGMHIYQRFLLPGQLLFGVMIAIMLKAVIDARPVMGLRIAFALFATAAFAVAFYVLHHAAPANSVGLNNYLVFELMLAAICMAALLIPDKTFAFVSAVALFTLPSLDLMYDRSQGGSAFDEQVKRHGVMLDVGLRQGVVAYLDRFRSQGKELIKYVDITPRWSQSGVETFPKAFPYFVLKEVSLCPYTGWNFYLSSTAKYMATIPYGGDGRFRPDLERLRVTGADFVVAMESDLPSLVPITGALTKSDIYRLPAGVVLAPLASSRLQSRPSEAALYDNGYLRVVRGDDAERDPAADSVTANVSARQSSEGGGKAALAVDGNTSGVFAEGSVTHTTSEPGAWLEIDLGTSQPVGSVRLWNRTEAPQRLSEYWLTITDTPAKPTQNAEALKEEGGPGLWQRKITLMPQPSLTIETTGAVGRYVRIQLARQTPHPENILSLAEVEAFRPAASTAGVNSSTDDPTVPFVVHSFNSNNSNQLSLDVECQEATTAKYLLWHNPRLRYVLNGKPVVPSVHGGLTTVSLPPGRNALHISYHNPTLAFFWLEYAAYGLIAAWASITLLVERIRTPRNEAFLASLHPIHPSSSN